MPVSSRGVISNYAIRPVIAQGAPSTTPAAANRILRPDAAATTHFRHVFRTRVLKPARSRRGNVSPTWARTEKEKERKADAGIPPTTSGRRQHFSLPSFSFFLFPFHFPEKTPAE